MTGIRDADLFKVFISHLMQMGIASAGFVLLFAFSLQGSHFTRFKDAWSGVHGVQKPYRSTTRRNLDRARDSLVSALHEFQRAQCFFGLTVQIASIIVLFSGGIAATSIVQVIMNYNFITFVAANNMYCVTFTYWYLRGNIQRSFYTLLLSVCSFVLAFSMTFIIDARYNIPGIQGLLSAETFDSCGSTTPLVTCHPGRQWGFGLPLVNGGPGQGIEGSDIITQFVAWIFMLATILQYLQPVYQKRLEKVRSKLRKRRGLRAILRPLWVATKITFFSLFIAEITASTAQLYEFIPYGAIDTNTWSIGQVIGIAVWIPPIFEFVQMYLSKPPLFNFRNRHFAECIFRSCLARHF